LLIFAGLVSEELSGCVLDDALVAVTVLFSFTRLHEKGGPLVSWSSGNLFFWWSF